MSGRTQPNGLKLQYGWFRLDIRDYSFTERLIRPREVVEYPSLQVFKRHVDMALRGMVYWNSVGQVSDCT